ncbi:unnamed protein product [Effrenium voratum]|nr:unnamed protein product [Effrenium voratum]
MMRTMSAWHSPVVECVVYLNQSQEAGTKRQASQLAGTISHATFCLAGDHFRHVHPRSTACAYCGRLYFPASLSVHQERCPRREKKRLEKKRLPPSTRSQGAQTDVDDKPRRLLVCDLSESLSSESLTEDDIKCSMTATTVLPHDVDATMVEPTDDDIKCSMTATTDLPHHVDATVVEPTDGAMDRAHRDPRDPRAVRDREAAAQRPDAAPESICSIRAEQQVKVVATQTPPCRVRVLPASAPRVRHHSPRMGSRREIGEVQVRDRRCPLHRSGSTPSLGHRRGATKAKVLEQSKDAKANTGAKERKSMGTKGVEGNARAASAPAPRGVKIAPAGKTAKDPKPQNLHKDTSKAKRKPSRKPKEPEAAGVSQPKQPGPVSSAQTLLMPSSWGNFETADLEFRSTEEVELNAIIQAPPLVQVQIKRKTRRGFSINRGCGCCDQKLCN